MTSVGSCSTEPVKLDRGAMLPGPDPAAAPARSAASFWRQPNALTATHRLHPNVYRLAEIARDRRLGSTLPLLRTFQGMSHARAR